MLVITITYTHSQLLWSLNVPAHIRKVNHALEEGEIIQEEEEEMEIKRVNITLEYLE